MKWKGSKEKSSINAENVSYRIWFAVGFAEALSRVLNLGEVVVTSLRDGTHSDNSLHYKGLAVDLRTRHLTEDQLTFWVQLLKTYLDPLGFDTVREDDHVHIEYDPKIDEVFDGRVA